MNRLILKLWAVALLGTTMPNVFAAMPGMKGAQHLGITVPNAQEAVDFFVDVIGCEAFFTIGPFGPYKDNWMKKNLNVHKKAIIEVAHFVRCGNGTNLEIFQYTSPDQSRDYVKNSDWGGNHLAFYVEDFDDARAYLKNKGVKLLGGPNHIDGGGADGLRWQYFLAPWGQTLEIVSYPNGMGYMKQTMRRMWDPRD